MCIRDRGNEADAKREYLSLAEYYWKNKNVEKTDYYAQKAIDFKSIEAHYLKGAALAAKGKHDDAKKELEMILKFKANHINAKYLVSFRLKETIGYPSRNYWAEHHSQW